MSIGSTTATTTTRTRDPEHSCHWILDPSRALHWSATRAPLERDARSAGARILKLYCYRSAGVRILELYTLYVYWVY